MIVAATGHRPNKLGGYDNLAAEQRLIEIAVDWINKHKPSKIISGMALGWDMMVARAAILTNTPFIAAIPFLGQELAWPKESRRMYRKLLECASEKIIVSPGPYAARKMHVRNVWMVNHSEHILAMWDGSSGGTANCIDYAKQVHQPVTNLYHLFKSR